MPMNKEVKKEWLKRLRSKKAKQITGNLKDVADNGSVSGHCCLGVLCEIHQETHPKFKWRGEGSPSYGSTARNSSETGLTTSVMKWAGLNKEDCLKFTFLNDLDRLTFPEIAKVVSKEY